MTARHSPKVSYVFHYCEYCRKFANSNFYAMLYSKAIVDHMVTDDVFGYIDRSS